MTVALITGVNGQDGSYLAELLLSKGYKVYGTVRGKNPRWPDGIDINNPNFQPVDLDLNQPSAIIRLMMVLKSKEPDIDECYNLAAQSHVGVSFLQAEETYKVTGMGACLLMEEYFNMFPSGKFYQASSSEMFGNVNATTYEPLHLDSGFAPTSPYAVAKLMAHYCTESYRKRGYFAVSGILFNHESERRHFSFVTQKIVTYVASLRLAYECGLGQQYPKLRLGHIGAWRDWGYAPQYVDIMWRLLQKDRPEPVVVGTGHSVSVEYFVQNAFEYVGLDWKDHVEINYGLMRPADVDYLCADGTVANTLLGDQLIDVDKLIPIMVNHQLQIQGEK